MTYDVRLVQVASLPLLVVRRRATRAQLPAVIPEACGEVWTFIRAAGIDHAGLNVVVYRHVADDVFDLECGVQLTRQETGTGSVLASSTPAGTAATTVHFGPYSLLREAHRATQQWCREHGTPLAGTSWEVYGHWNDNQATLKTDIFYLVRS